MTEGLHNGYPLTIVEAQEQLEEYAKSRRLPRTGGTDREYCRRVAQLWWDEARIWTNLTHASDFPDDPELGGLLAMAARHAAMFAHMKGASWRTSSGDPAVNNGPNNGLDPS